MINEKECMKKTENELRKRFWDLEDARTQKYSQFTREFIEDNWEIRFEEIKN